MQIGGLPYRVIGVVAKQGTLFGISLDKFAIMPFNAPGRRLICPINILDALHRPDRRPDDDAGAMGEAEAHHAEPAPAQARQENNFAFQTAEGALGSWQKISRVLFLALPGLVAISLVVGGIVIMNIMLMAVSERTREIGIRKALGARRGDILAQFVVESATLSLAGAVLGIGFGLVLAWVVKAVTPLPAAVAPWSIARRRDPGCLRRRRGRSLPGEPGLAARPDPGAEGRVKRTRSGGTVGRGWPKAWPWRSTRCGPTR